MIKANPQYLEYAGQVKFDKDHLKEGSEAVKVGERCELKVGGNRGEVKYVGKVIGLTKGYWVGVILDEPTGDSNGKVKDKAYFECAQNFGKFVRPTDINVGDYPEIDEFDEDEDMI